MINYCYLSTYIRAFNERHSIKCECLHTPLQRAPYLTIDGKMMEHIYPFLVSHYIKCFCIYVHYTMKCICCCIYIQFGYNVLQGAHRSSMLYLRYIVTRSKEIFTRLLFYNRIFAHTIFAYTPQKTINFQTTYP